MKRLAIALEGILMYRNRPCERWSGVSRGACFTSIEGQPDPRTAAAPLTGKVRFPSYTGTEGLA